MHANKIVAVESNMNQKSTEASTRGLNREAYERQVAELKKCYPDECIGFLDGKLVAHDRDAAEMIRKFSQFKKKSWRGND